MFLIFLFSLYLEDNFSYTNSRLKTSILELNAHYCKQLVFISRFYVECRFFCSSTESVQDHSVFVDAFIEFSLFVEEVYHKAYNSNCSLIILRIWDPFQDICVFLNDLNATTIADIAYALMVIFP
jgi:hypothetical protein